MYLLVDVGGEEKFMSGFDLHAGRFRNAEVRGVMRKEYPSLSVLQIAKKNPGDFRIHLTASIKYHRMKLSFFEKQLSDLNDELEAMK